MVHLGPVSLVVERNVIEKERIEERNTRGQLQQQAVDDKKRSRHRRRSRRKRKKKKVHTIERGKQNRAKVLFVVSWLST